MVKKMLLQSKILVRRSPQEVWAYMGDYANVPEWDRGVGAVRQNPGSPRGVGFEFDTLGRTTAKDATGESGKMSYRVAAADPAIGCTLQLTNSDGNARFFKQAEWRFTVDPAPDGAVVTCIADFQLRLRYLLLAPVLFLMRKQIDRDLRGLKQAIEKS